MDSRYLIVIPLYNHASGISGVLRGVFEFCESGHEESKGRPAVVLVVDDGSTDDGADKVAELCGMYNRAQDNATGENSGAFAALPPLNLVRHDGNKGKGLAIMTAAAWAAERGFTHIVTLDADGQHRPADMPALLQASAADPGAIVVGARDFSSGNVPGGSRFGRGFSGFWMRVQTGVAVSDMQSGFRIYPVGLLQSLKVTEKRFAFEMEVLVRAAWSGFAVLSVPVSVYYPPAGERVSHFRMFYDNLRITMMNTRLTVRALIPLPFTQRERDGEGRISVLRPVESIRRLLLRASTPKSLAASTFTAVLINILPLIGLQSILTLLAIGWLGLNRVWTLAVHHALWPPLIIPICLEAGHFMRNGRFLTEFSWTTLAEQAPSRLLDWVLGGLVAGPLVALFFALVVYLTALSLKRGLGARGERHA